jgi:hypothetical protein
MGGYEGPNLHLSYSINSTALPTCQAPSLFKAQAG